MFKSNVGSIDRLARIALGLALIAIVFVGPKTPWGWVGLVPLLTGLMSSCPLYSIFDISSRGR